MHLDGEVGCLARHLRAIQRDGGRGDATILSGHVQPGSLTDHGSTREDPGLLVGDHRLDQLEVADRRAALRDRHGVGDGLVEGALGAADGEPGDVDPAPRQGGHRRTVSDLAVTAHQGVRRGLRRRRDQGS